MMYCDIQYILYVQYKTISLLANMFLAALFLKEKIKAEHLFGEYFLEYHYKGIQIFGIIHIHHNMSGASTCIQKKILIQVKFE